MPSPSYRRPVNDVAAKKNSDFGLVGRLVLANHTNTVLCSVFLILSFSAFFFFFLKELSVVYCNSVLSRMYFCFYLKKKHITVLCILISLFNVEIIDVLFVGPILFLFQFLYVVVDCELLFLNVTIYIHIYV